MLETLKHIHVRIKEGMLKDMIRQTKWIYQYARHYWLAMIFYTALGLFGTVVGLGSSVVSKDLVDIITGHQTGKLVQTFCLMVGLSIGNTLVSQITSYASNWISLKVDAEIKADIFSKMLVTDWESITNYHTGDLLTRWSSDASTISSGILSWIPNLIINIFKFISAFAIVIYQDWTFAIFSFIGIPVSLLMSRTLMYLGIRKHPDPKEHDHQYSAAKCLKCGLCLEVCPNYLGAKDDFYGAEFVNNVYLLHSSSLNRKRALEKQYEEHFAKQCSKSLACRDICPAHLQTLSSISYMNRR